MSNAGRTPEELAARVKALESMMIEQGLVTAEMIDHYADIYENQVGPQLGARVVAKAWVDPEFKSRLLEDAPAACRELGIGGGQGEHMVVLEDTPEVHHAIVCTLCSCYPWPVLGPPPNWYKDPQYRSRMIREPRKLLADEFGYVVEESKEIRIWDSSSEIRYWVLPERPEGTEGWDEERLAALVSRDAMIGVGSVQVPS